MDVGSWLRSLGLGQYEAAFRDNAVDAEVLFELSDGDLAQIGVLLGHRKRLRKAIGELASADEIAPTSLAPSTTAERCPLTAMFCDLVGSTALSARLDPEDMRRVIRVYQDASPGVIALYHRFVAKFMGDNILAYFAFPRAHEDDPEGAVRAGLASFCRIGRWAAKEFNLTEAAFGRECPHVATTEGKRIQATQRRAGG
jgi:class 3 adenylate cyclase